MRAGSLSYPLTQGRRSATLSASLPLFLKETDMYNMWWTLVKTIPYCILTIIAFFASIWVLYLIEVLCEFAA